LFEGDAHTFFFVFLEILKLLLAAYIHDMFGMGLRADRAGARRVFAPVQTLKERDVRRTERDCSAA
jgi:hypothetical protein